MARWKLSCCPLALCVWESVCWESVFCTRTCVFRACKHRSSAHVFLFLKRMPGAKLYLVALSSLLLTGMKILCGGQETDFDIEYSESVSSCVFWVVFGRQLIVSMFVSNVYMLSIYGSTPNPWHPLSLLSMPPSRLSPPSRLTCHLQGDSQAAEHGRRIEISKDICWVEWVRITRNHNI